MNYYKGLKKIGKTGDFDHIPDDLLYDYISDFMLELNNRSAKQIHDQFVHNIEEQQRPWNLLNDIHYTLAKSHLTTDEYQQISKMIIELKNLLK